MAVGVAIPLPAEAGIHRAAAPRVIAYETFVPIIDFPGESRDPSPSDTIF